MLVARPARRKMYPKEAASSKGPCGPGPGQQFGFLPRDLPGVSAEQSMAHSCLYPCACTDKRFQNVCWVRENENEVSLGKP